MALLSGVGQTVTGACMEASVAKKHPIDGSTTPLFTGCRGADHYCVKAGTLFICACSENAFNNSN